MPALSCHEWNVNRNPLSMIDFGVMAHAENLKRKAHEKSTAPSTNDAALTGDRREAATCHPQTCSPG